jgi:putative protein kinase ArgK-like GTPase of G3E family
VLTTVASEGTGVDVLFDALDAFRTHLAGEAGTVRRRAQAAAILRRLAGARAASRVDELARSDAFGDAVEAVAAGSTDPYAAAEALFSS